MENVNKFTKTDKLEVINYDDFDGAVIGIKLEVGYYDIVHAVTRDMDCDVEDDQEMIANAELIITTFTAAKQLADMGYDAKKFIEVLPKMIESSLSTADTIRLYDL